MAEYYNVLESGHQVLSFAKYGLVGVVVGILLIIVFRDLGANPFLKGFAYLITGGSILWVIGLIVVLGIQLIDCRRALKNGNYKEVEGIVENFVPLPHTGRRVESFSVKGILFEYSDFEMTPGFNNTKPHGGPIDQGKYVKIRYHEGYILQLWVKE